MVGLSIEGATIGYDSVELTNCINNINTYIVNEIISTINRSVPEIRNTVDTVWSGRSADAFKNRFQYDSRTVVETLLSMKNIMESNLAQIGANVDEYDQAIAAAILGEDYASDISRLQGMSIDIGRDYSDYFDGAIDLQNSIQSAVSTVATALKRTGATVGTFANSLVEGVFNFGEAIVDTATILGTAVATPVTGLVDLGGWIYSKITGNEYESLTKKMWDGEMKFVSTDFVGSAYNSFYENIGIGKWLKNNSYAFDTTRAIGSGLGYTAGVVVATVATFGAAGVAVSSGSLAVGAGTAGFGKGAEYAWGNGASLGEGLLYATGNAVWEGTQFYIGGKIAGMNAFNSTSANIATRIGLDTVDGAVEGFVQPGLETIYRDESFRQLFNEAGGWKNVGTQAAIGAIGSATGEAFDFGKFFNNSGETADVSIYEQGMRDSDVIKEESVDTNKTSLVSDQQNPPLAFSKKYYESITQMSDYYGDAGGKVNDLFLQGKTAQQILDELNGQEKLDFQNFLQNTRQGQYLENLSDLEIRSMTTYTGGHYQQINGMLRDEDISGTINGIDSKTLIDNIDAAITKYGGLETKTEIFRAVGVSAFSSQNSEYAALFKGIDTSDLNQVYSSLKVLEGKPFGDLGYMSTSPGYSASFAKYPSCPIVLDIIADKGTPGAYINQISRFYNSENEFLLARNTELQMLEVLPPEKDIKGLEKIVIKCVVK